MENAGRDARDYKRVKYEEFVTVKCAKKLNRRDWSALILLESICL